MSFRLTTESQKKLNRYFSSDEITAIETVADYTNNTVRVFYTKDSNIISEQLEIEYLTIEELNIERDLLLKEYELCTDLGKHWDLLRWNVSKFFLSIETVFIIGIANAVISFRGEYIKHKHLFNYGLIGVALINILICIMWYLRNNGIHIWHQASLKRQLIIEADPIMGSALKHNTTIINTIKNRGEGYKILKEHFTGKIELIAPPIIFIIAWVFILIFMSVIL